jgi:hypothetical protein
MISKRRIPTAALLARVSADQLLRISLVNRPMRSGVGTSNGCIFERKASDERVAHTIAFSLVSRSNSSILNKSYLIAGHQFRMFCTM